MPFAMAHRVHENEGLSSGIVLSMLVGEPWKFAVLNLLPSGTSVEMLRLHLSFVGEPQNLALSNLSNAGG